MRSTIRHPVRLLSALVGGIALLAASSCGGGSSVKTSGGTTGGGAGTGGAVLTITTQSLLPSTVMQHAYTTTLAASNGQGTLKWSIVPLSATALFTNGLAVNPETGVITGNANFAGTAAFMATVIDSTAQSASKSFTITAYSPLTAAASKALKMSQYSDAGSSSMSPDYQGGVQPLTFSMTSGSLPPGVRLDPKLGTFTGAPNVAGTYIAMIVITDSFSPQESASQQINITVDEPTLRIANSVPSRIPLNVPYSGAVIAIGGRPPYSFALTAGTLPQGLAAFNSSGTISGTPTHAGASWFNVQVTDSSSPQQTAQAEFNPIMVSQAMGRNDSIQTATTVGNGSVQASISPYIDELDKAPLAGDNDYYKLTSIARSIVHLQTIARQNSPNNPLDTVLELLDANGVRLNTCRQPGDTTNFTSPCINDDASASNTDSALDLLVPGAASTGTTFYAHVFDWRGDARPDMLYTFLVSGAVSPLNIQNISVIPAARGLSYSQQFSSSNGSGTVTWSAVSGSLPPGLTMTSAGAISGVATIDGNYVFTATASDGSTPPQAASAQFHIQVVEPIVINSPATWPDACVNQPYSFAMQISGGLPPIIWSYYSAAWPMIILNQATATFSGTPGVAGTYHITLSPSDATTHAASQIVSLTVNSCPGF